MLTESSLAWLRTLVTDADASDHLAVDPDATADAIVAMAQLTPAWTEPYRAILDRLIDDVAGADPIPAAACPQIVDVDFPTMAFTRAEWLDGNLRLRTSPLYDNPKVFTSFRILGAEPRNWDVHGFDGVSLDLSSSTLNVRVPLIAGDLELIRSSY